MHFHFPTKYPEPQPLRLIAFQIPAGFPSPAADYVESRIDLNKLLIANPSFTFYAYAEGDSMAPLIRDGDLMVVDRKADSPDGSVVLASVNNDFCVKHIHRWPDGSMELRPHNARYESIHLPCEFEGEFEIVGRIVWTCRNLKK